MVIADKPYQVVGTRPVRPDGVDKVTGRAQYGADVRPAGMLHGKVLRSPHAHARIKSIDTSKALAHPGVVAAITAADVPDQGTAPIATLRGPIPPSFQVDHLLANDTVVYRGQPVAAIAATGLYAAEDAIDLIEVEYEVLPPVMSIDEAIAPDAPILHDPALTEGIDNLFDPIDGKPTNIARQVKLELGDLDAGFGAADVVIEREYSTSTAHQGYIEPHTATAHWNQDGQLTVWTATQGAFGVRDALAGILKHPVSRIRVIPTEIGGGFGGKLSSYFALLTALLSKQTGRPVQLSMNRTEVFEASGPTSATRSRVKLGATRDGKIVAADVHLEFEAGAYPGAPLPGGARCGLAPYAIENQRVDGFEVVVNKPKTAAYRAPGAPAVAFGVESAIDELADQLALDPIEIRLLNIAHEGDRRSEGTPHGAIGHEDVMRAAADTPHYRSELDGPNRGRGVATGFWFNGGNESSAYANTNPDGTVSLVLGSVDIGGQRAALAMQFAESMGITYDQVKPHVTDTDSIGFTGNTGGSRTTFATGWAVHEAAIDLRKQLEARAAQLWNVDAADVAYDNDGVIRGPEGKELTFAELASRLPASGGMLQGQADVKPTTVGSAFAAHIVDVEVDPHTGKVEILRYTALQDVGTAVHPSYVEGQIQGAVAQGVGMAVSEEYVWGDDGRLLNASFLDYRMPTTLDVPELETVLVEVPNPGHPYGVRGVGEVPLVPPLAAVANAITHATGHRMRHLPISPRVLLDELMED